MPDNTNSTRQYIIHCSLVPGALVREGDPGPDWSIHIAPQTMRRDTDSGLGVSFTVEPIDDLSTQKEDEGESKLDGAGGDCHYSRHFPQI